MGELADPLGFDPRASRFDPWAPSNAAVAHLAEHFLGKEEALGSKPSGGSMRMWCSRQHRTLPRCKRRFDPGHPLHAVLAQLAEAPRSGRGGSRFESEVRHDGRLAER